MGNWNDRNEHAHNTGKSTVSSTLIQVSGEMKLTASCKLSTVFAYHCSSLVKYWYNTTVG